MLRRELWRRGFRYRVDVADLPGRPDIVFTKARLVVFVDGDFWHGRDWSDRKARLETGSNALYWISKIERNIARDRAVIASLEDDGWCVLRVWEGDVRARLLQTVDVVLTSLAARESYTHRNRSTSAATTSRMAASEPIGR